MHGNFGSITLDFDPVGALVLFGPPRPKDNARCGNSLPEMGSSPVPRAPQRLKTEFPETSALPPVGHRGLARVSCPAQNAHEARLLSSGQLVLFQAPQGTPVAGTCARV